MGTRGAVPASEGSHAASCRAPVWGHADPRSLRAQGAPSQSTCTGSASSCASTGTPVRGARCTPAGKRCARRPYRKGDPGSGPSSAPLWISVWFSFHAGQWRDPVGHRRNPRAKAAALPCGPGSTSSVNILGQSLQQRPEPSAAQRHSPRTEPGRMTGGKVQRSEAAALGKDGRSGIQAELHLLRC